MAAQRAKGAAKRLSRDQRRRSILSAAATAFARAGYAGTSMDDIAAAAGVTRLILYRHFPSKEDLYLEVVGTVAGRIGEAISTGQERGEFYGLHARAFLSVAREDPDGFRLLWRHTEREEAYGGRVQKLRRRAVRYALPKIAAVVEDPRVEEWAAETIVTFLIGSVLNWLDAGDPERDDLFVLLCTRSLVALIGAWSGKESILGGVLDVEVPPATSAAELPLREVTA